MADHVGEGPADVDAELDPVSHHSDIPETFRNSGRRYIKEFQLQRGDPSRLLCAQPDPLQRRTTAPSYAGNGDDDREQRPMSETDIKSAKRVLEILEYFDTIRADASVMEITRALAYPQSSTSKLLKCLTGMGYLNYDSAKRRYAPTYRIALLGSWVHPPNMTNERVYRVMEELSDQTHETIILGEQPGTIVRYIFVVPSRKDIRLHVGPGTVRPLLRSGLGRLFLASYPPEKVKTLLKRINADAKPGDLVARFSDVEAELELIRQRGYCVSTKSPTGAGTVSALLPHEPGNPRIAMAIGGLATAMEANAHTYGTLIQDAIRRHLL
jgi:DNA-binding IclR family transcriptional regulator